MGNLTYELQRTKQLSIFEQIKSGLITQKEAALKTWITSRCRKKIKRYLKEGMKGLFINQDGNQAQGTGIQKKKSY